MFEVRGWKISASLKTDNSVANPGPGNGDKPQSKRKDLKRKRGHGKNKTENEDVTVTDNTLGELWERHIEGKSKESKGHDGQKMSKKRQKKSPKDVSQNADAKSSLKTAVADAASDRMDKEIQAEVKDGQKIKNKKAKRRDKSDTSHSHDGAKLHHGDSAVQATQDSTANSLADNTSAATKLPPTLTSLQSKMSHKLASARFRHLNEQLYTTPSAQSFHLFEASPDMFADYHRGFAQQVAVWPENPVDAYVRDILLRGGVGLGSHSKHKRKGAGRDREQKPMISGDSPSSPLPRSKNPPHVSTIADLGCGIAGLATALQSHLSRLRLQVCSFDLHSPNPLVTRADISNLPLRTGEVDIAIFCLALMGTNWIDFVEEAWRVLRWRGELWIAEIKSRFARPATRGAGAEGNSLSKRKQKMRNSKEGKRIAQEQEDRENGEVLAVEVDGVQGPASETDVTAFVRVLQRRGFSLAGEPDLSNKMFVKMTFLKDGAPVAGKHRDPDAAHPDRKLQGGSKKFLDKEDVPAADEASVLKPCVYKLR